MKVVNFLGGPGVGKSTVAADVFVLMKKGGYSVEFVDEYAKEKTYEREFGKLEDQLYILANQHRKLNRLWGQVEYIVTDSPIILSGYYNLLNLSKDLNTISYKQEVFLPLVLNIWNSYENYSVLLERDDSLEYQAYGRNQTHEQAKRMDDELTDYLKIVKCDMLNVRAGTSASSILESLKQKGL